MRSTAAIFALASLSPLGGLAQQPRSPSPDHLAATLQIEQSLVDVIARAEPSVVAISRAAAKQATRNDLRPSELFGDRLENASGATAPVTVGGGVIIDRAGLVLTDYLAVHDGDEHSVTTIDRTTYPATIRAADPHSGLAVLAIDRTAGPQGRNSAPDNFPAIRIGDAETLRKGQFVVAIGNPYAIQTDGQPTASWGIVTNFGRKAPSGTNLNDEPGPERDYRTTLHHLGTLIQTDARLGFNAAGGALINVHGELVGLTTTTSTIAGHERPAGYAIPMSAPIRRIINTLKQGREAEYGMLGVAVGHATLATATRDDSRPTLLHVFPGTPAARAGLHEADVVTRIAEQPVDDMDAVQLAISMMRPGTVTSLDYLRHGQPTTTRVTLAKMEVAGKKIITKRPAAWRGIRVDYSTALAGSEFTQAVASGAYDPEGCVLVREVEQGSKAWNAGVRKGMFISHVGGKRVTTPAEFQAATRDFGDKFDIRLTQPAASREK